MPDGGHVQASATATGRPLLEREPELAALSRSLERARAGSGSLLLIEGPGGIGKTELVMAFGEQAQREGLTVLRGRAVELEREVPFGLAMQLFSRVLASAQPPDHEALLGARAVLVQSLLEPRQAAQARMSTELPTLVSALHDLTVDLAARCPLAIAVDDAQWVDRPSMAFLSHLAPQLARLPLALVITVRRGEPVTAERLLSGLRAVPGARTLSPGPLSEPAVGEVLELELPGAEEPLVAACARASGGNPFLTRELALGLRAEGVEPTARSVARVEQLVPATVLHSSLTRIARLGEPARRIAIAAAVLGDGATLRQAIALSQQEARAAERAADALAAAGILQEGEPLRFVHPLLAKAVQTDLAPFARARAHRDAARLLAQDGAGVQELAAHLLLSRGEGDGWTVSRLREAARQDLARGDPEAAAHLLARALAEPPAAADRAEVLLELAEAQTTHGLTDAQRHVREALELGIEGHLRVRGLRLLSHVELGLGDHHAAAAALREALEELGRAHPISQHVLAEYLTANRFTARLYEDAVSHLAPVVAGARRGDLPSDPGLLAHVGLQMALEGEPARSVRAVAERASAADPLIDGASHGMFMGLLVQALCCVDELERAEALAHAALSVARERGSFLGVSVASFHRALARYHRGALAPALEDLELALGPLREGWSSGAAWPQSLRAQAQLERGDVLAAAETAAAAIAMPGSMEEPVIEFARARVALAAREPQVALGRAEWAGRSLLEDYGIDNPGLLPWRAVAARAALAQGLTVRARELAEEQLAGARLCGAVPRSMGLALRTLAAVEGGAPAIEALQEATAVLRDSPSRLERVRALADLGAALRRAGRRSEALAPLREALQVANEMGAGPLTAFARAELRALGARPRRAAFSGIDALTPAEDRVARLAAQGLTNAEIARELLVTSRTVQTHLAHTYRKLDISSRRHLARALAEGEDGGPLLAQARSRA